MLSIQDPIQTRTATSFSKKSRAKEASTTDISILLCTWHRPKRMPRTKNLAPEPIHVLGPPLLANYSLGTFPNTRLPALQKPLGKRISEKTRIDLRDRGEAFILFGVAAAKH